METQQERRTRLGNWSPYQEANKRTVGCGHIPWKTKRMALSRGLVLWRKVEHNPMASIISRRFLLQTHKNSIRGILSVAANGSCLVTASARCKKGLSSWRPTHTSFYSSSTRVSSSGGGRASLKVKARVSYISSAPRAWFEIWRLWRRWVSREGIMLIITCE